MTFYKSYSTAMDMHTPIKYLGAPTNPMVARQLDEFGKLLNQGIKNIEIGTIDPTKFEQIPSQHFDEVRRLAQITDSHVSVHAPLLELSGFPTQEGERVWKEEQRESVEQQVFSILERAQQLSNGENVPVVFHAGRTKSQEYGLPWDPKTGPEGKGLRMQVFDDHGHPVFENDKPKIDPSNYRSIMAVNKDTGEVTQLSYEEKRRIGQEELDIWDPFKKLHSLNSSQWDDEKLKILNYQKDIEEIKEKALIKQKQNDAIDKSLLVKNPKYQQMKESNEKDLFLMEGHLNEINRKMSSDYESAYDKFVRFAKDEDRKEAEALIEKMKKEYKESQGRLKEIYQERNELYRQAQNIKSEEEKQQIIQEMDKKRNEILTESLRQSKEIVAQIARLETPKVWVPVMEFAIDKTTDTIAGAISKLYKKLQEEGNESKTPFIALENFFVDTPMSRGAELRKAVIESREKLAKRLVEDCELSPEKAKKEAEKLVGATWDVGHINNLRKAGYEGEELKKEVLKDTREVADVVKHVHITDNFGFFDSHLPPGMGNVPIPEIMEHLEKTWAKLEEEGKLHQTPRRIVEAGGFVAEIGQNPTVGILEYFGSPLYKISPNPYFWQPEGTPRNMSTAYSGYKESFIDFPQQHFNMYGSSFTTLPKSVGGQVGGESSRFSGTPNQ